MLVLLAAAGFRSIDRLARCRELNLFADGAARVGRLAVRAALGAVRVRMFSANS